MQLAGLGYKSMRLEYNINSTTVPLMAQDDSFVVELTPIFDGSYTDARVEIVDKVSGNLIEAVNLSPLNNIGVPVTIGFGVKSMTEIKVIVRCNFADKDNYLPNVAEGGHENWTNAIYLTDWNLILHKRKVTKQQVSDTSDYFYRPKYAFGFNGQERDDEIRGDGNSVNFKFRFYDSRLGRWLSIDPLAYVQSSWSPYHFAANNPIWNIDLDGLIPYPITVRSFAPFATFGGGFHGDERGFSTSSSVSARVHHRINFDTDKTTLGAKAWSSPTWHTLNSDFKSTATPVASIEKGSFTLVKSGDVKTFSFRTSYSGANPLTPGAPNIDVFTDFTISENKSAGTLSISGKLTGDNFPSTEAFITDPSGQDAFIGVGFYEGSPFTSLWGENKDNPITEFNFTINTDDDGNFTGVSVGDKSYTLDEWNAMFETADPHQNANEDD